MSLLTADIDPKGKPMNSRLVRSSINIGLLLLVNALWGIQFTFYKLLEHVPSPAVSLVFVVLAGSFVFPFFLVERCRRLRAGVPTDNKERSLRRWDNIFGFLMAGVVGATASSLFYAWGVSKSTASNGALLGLTGPILTGVLAVLILRERMTLVRWVSLAIALTGVVLLSMRAPEGAAKEAGLAIDWAGLKSLLINNKYLVGNLLILAACAGGSLSNVFYKSLLRRFSVLEVLVGIYFLTTLANAAIVVCFEPSAFGALAACSRREMVYLLLLGLNGGLTAILWLFLVARLDVSQAVVSLYLTPIFGVLEAAVFLGEQITLLMVLGGAITLAGTVLVATMDKTSSETEPVPETQPTIEP